MKRFRVIGLISGTSVDGIDAALVEILSEKNIPEIQLKAFQTIPYDEKIKKRILEASAHHLVSLDHLCELHAMLGEAFADAAVRLAQSARVSLKKIDLIGSHGQTIRHLPPRLKKIGATLQLAEPAIIAERTGVTTVADFRAGDMAAGGQGAPLAPYLHYCLFRALGYDVGVLNIGGISNITTIPKNAKLQNVIAFDTGPGNMVIDALITSYTHRQKSFDEDGRMAARGDVQPRLLKKLMSHPFLLKRPPKSTGREVFGQHYIQWLKEKTGHLKKEDVIATVTAFTAGSVAESYERFIRPSVRIKELIVGGGGVKNKTLFHMIQRLMPDVQIKRFEDYHLNSDAIEAMAFALLAYETMRGQANNMPSVTGAAHPVCLGKIIPGANFKRLDLN